MDEAKEMCQDRSKWNKIVSAYPCGKEAWWYAYLYVFGIKYLLPIPKDLCTALGPLSSIEIMITMKKKRSPNLEIFAVVIFYHTRTHSHTLTHIILVSII